MEDLEKACPYEERKCVGEGRKGKVRGKVRLMEVKKEECVWERGERGK